MQQKDKIHESTARNLITAFSVVKAQIVQMRMNLLKFLRERVVRNFIKATGAAHRNKHSLSHAGRDPAGMREAGVNLNC